MAKLLTLCRDGDCGQNENRIVMYALRLAIQQGWYHMVKVRRLIMQPTQPQSLTILPRYGSGTLIQLHGALEEDAACHKTKA